MSLLKLPDVLSANPHYYDYLSCIDLKSDGTVELFYGEGQALRFLVKGRYTMQNGRQPGQFKIVFTQMIEFDPFAKEKIGQIDDLMVTIKRETGLFTFIQQIPYRVEKPAETPCLLYKTRYHLNPDPVMGSANITYFYASQDCQQMTYGTLIGQNIPITENPQNVPE